MAKESHDWKFGCWPTAKARKTMEGELRCLDAGVQRIVSQGDESVVHSIWTQSRVQMCYPCKDAQRRGDRHRMGMLARWLIFCWLHKAGCTLRGRSSCMCRVTELTIQKGIESETAPDGNHQSLETSGFGYPSFALIVPFPSTREFHICTKYVEHTINLIRWQKSYLSSFLKENKSKHFVGFRCILYNINPLEIKSNWVRILTPWSPYLCDCRLTGLTVQYNIYVL